jgi:diguanylate cyclase (GGDEF)-like protein/PAS domain S-box-containing protein
MRYKSYFVLIALLLLGVFGYTLYTQYQGMLTTQQKLLVNEGRSLALFTRAFRHTYQKAFAEHNISLDAHNVHLLPVMTIDEIAKRFSKQVHGDVEIRTVSDRPRNPRNMADPFEREMIAFFRAHPERDYRIVKRGEDFYYLTPLRTQRRCLRCHGKREEAPSFIRRKYDRAYDYHLGEIRGMSSIRIMRKQLVAGAKRSFVEGAVTQVVLALVLLAAIFVLMRRIHGLEHENARKLERRVDEKTRELARSKLVFETLFEKSSDGIFVLSNQIIVQCNEKIIQMLHYDSKEELLGKRPAMLSPPTQPDGRSSLEKGDAMLELALRNGRHQFEWVHLRKGGEPFHVEVTLTPILLDGRKVIYVTWRDISEKKQAESKLIEQQEALEHQAYHDALTHLPNRLLLLDRLEQGIRRAKRNGTTIAVMFFDIDNFKKINDSMGHHVGDEVLIHFADKLRKIVRAEDTLARLGGDEFTVVAESDQDGRFAARLAEDILALFAEPIRLEEHSLYVTVSIGISIYPQDADNVADLLKFADAAMYQAKNDGKNRYRYYSPDFTRQLLERVALEEEIRHGLEHDEFTVYYQPQYDARNTVLSGLEALVRWHHPRRGMILPDTFVPLAEETGLIIALDRFVMRTAMAQMVAWRKRGFDPGRLSLNLSMRQLIDENYVPNLRAVMEQLGFRPEWLELEITEREMMQDPERSIRRLEVLSRMGITIAIDDFGTGYSSLSYLKRLPVDRLKIDRSFTDGVVTDNSDASIVRAIIALAESLELDVIAEGVETREQAAFLMENGCTMIQGYLYGKPISAAEFAALFSDGEEG